MAYKVIFDRSIFHKGIEKLQKSKVKECVNSGKIRVCFTVAFWEETLRLVNKNTGELQEQLTFLFSIDSGVWFRDIRSIVECECHRQGIPSFGDYFFTNEEIKLKWEGFISIAKGAVSIDPANDEYKVSVYPNMDQRVNDIKNFRNSSKQKKYSDFNDFYEKEKSFFLNRVTSVHNINVLNLNNCPWTESYLKAYMVCYFPLLKSKLKNDRNNRMDAEQLSYLLYADAIVSDDKKFMMTAFNLLYGNSKKQLLNLETFLDLIKNQ